MSRMAEPVRAFSLAALGAKKAEECAFGVCQSFSGRKWRFTTIDAMRQQALQHEGLSAPLAALLAARGVEAAEAADFLEPKLKSHLPDPYRLAHMERAAERFADAVSRGETIAVLGDYDVDGGCAAAMLLGYLRALKRDALLHIPDRMTEGYGPQPAAMRKLAAEGAKIIVTVDCGASSHTAHDAARAAGVDSIVLDHHAVSENPPAFAHVNPNGPDDKSGFTYLCGTGVSFLFLVAVQRVLRERGWFAHENIREPDLLEFLDLVALATIADVVQLIGLNRAFVRQGLRRLDMLTRPGIAALARLAKTEPPFAPYHLGFVFGPRINAGGRVGRCDLGARLLSGVLAADETERFAADLDLYNRERQAIEAAILVEAQAMAEVQAEKNFIFLAGEGWHAGVVGIVAGRLKEQFAKPVFVAGFEGSDAPGRGSARSVTGIDLGALVREAMAAGLITTGGGHAMAAGFSLTWAQREGFAAFLEQKLADAGGALQAARELFIDAPLSAAGAGLELLAELDRAGPFGAGNPEPLFGFANMQLAYAEVVGTDHIRARLVGADGAAVNAIAFRTASMPLGQGLLAARGRQVHVVGRLKRDVYGGVARVQLHLEDAALAGL
jgi:single-stranded-DNA-specific exonuclease